MLLQASSHCLNIFCWPNKKKYISVEAFCHTFFYHCSLWLFERLIENVCSDLRQTIAMTTTAMMKTKVAVADPTMSGSCSCHDFGGSALWVKERK